MMENHPTDSNATEEPPPAVSRVTDPGPAKQKDPKKVAAGRAGAAARKAKHERLLEELRDGKEALREMDAPADAPAAVPKEKPAAGSMTHSYDAFWAAS